MIAGTQYLEGTQGPYRNLVDYILGITHEIWESRQIDRIHDYYSPDTLIYTLGGLVRGSEAIVRNTRDTLKAFPDRLLIGDSVIWSRDGAGIFYSSHRITSPMTNRGDSAFGPATGKSVIVSTIADCVVENGVITREWLVRDNYGLVRQLGLDARGIAKTSAAIPQAQEHAAWMSAERERLGKSSATRGQRTAAFSDDRAPEFADSVLQNCWARGDESLFDCHYAPYAVLHDSRPVASGRTAIREHYGALRQSFSEASLSCDHVCFRPCDQDSRDVAVRWTLAARHTGDAWGAPATGAPVLILGVSHWRIIAGRIASEWTIYDRLAVLTQLYRAGSS